MNIIGKIYFINNIVKHNDTNREYCLQQSKSKLLQRLWQRKGKFSLQSKILEHSLAMLLSQTLSTFLATHISLYQISSRGSPLHQFLYEDTVSVH